uniref:Ferredoxin thioredoxin reductase alpha chain domain-containing protein n=1 Tax=Lotharella globosa TaxID=91324 RepID=A0A7S3YUW6_9EUKA|mmetsp:Transcript_6998/g.13704  ORF Transcript_6998/g.13704 Transcript_6998/m.13704 type:complete len:171 (+) Transcript_6998:23-535(+)
MMGPLFGVGGPLPLAGRMRGSSRIKGTAAAMVSVVLVVAGFFCSQGHYRGHEPSILSAQLSPRAISRNTPVGYPGISGTRRCVRARAHEGFEPGTEVKVVRPIDVFHVPGLKEGLNLEGRIGVILDDVSEYKGKEISANLPLRIQFKMTSDDGKEKEFQAHLSPDEVEKV